MRFICIHAGTTEDCIDTIDDFIRAGVKHLILGNAPPDPSNVREVYHKEIIPRFFD